MAKVTGLDGCRTGWIGLVRDLRTGKLDSRIFSTVRQLLEITPVWTAIAIDIPIGLPERGRRECDTLARQRLGRRRGSSVFPAPVRPALSAANREEASRITSRLDGRKVSAQAWGIYRKIGEVDVLLQDRKLREVVREVHPEVSFWAWNGSRAMTFGKKTPQGRRERRRLVDACYGESAYDDVRTRYRVGDVAHDDILDAFAALWTAERIARGEGVTLPERPERDSAGLPMTITY